MHRHVSSDREREGIALDVRKDDPYAAYDEIPFNVVSYNECDTWARLMVRADEILESLDILDYAFNHIPGGRLRVRVQRKIPEGEAVSRVEAPRGELIHYVKSDGTAYPYRVKVRAPTLANLVAFPDAIRGAIVKPPQLLFPHQTCVNHLNQYKPFNLFKIPK